MQQALDGFLRHQPHIAASDNGDYRFTGEQLAALDAGQECGDRGRRRQIPDLIGKHDQVE